MRLAVASVISALVAVASAYTQPDYSKPPVGNPILQPGLSEQVPAGKPYTIQWTPTTKGSISLVLLRGPATNVKPIDTIAEAIPNDGSYVWTPSTDLEPDVTHYGIMLVVEGTGEYQYSTQFGIQNPDYQGGSGSQSSNPTTSTATATVLPATETTSSQTSSETAIPTKTTKNRPMTTSAMSATTVLAPVTTTSSSSTSSSTSSSSSSSAEPTTMVTLTSVAAPSSGPSTPSAPNTGSESGNPSASSSSVASSSPSATLSTGAANRNALSMGAVAGAAFAVLAF